MVYAQGKVITSELLSLEPGRAVMEVDIVKAVRDNQALDQILYEVEGNVLNEALRQAAGDHAAAAARIGLTSRAFKDKLNIHGITR